MTVLVAMVLVMLSIYIIGYPFLRSARRPATQGRARGVVSDRSRGRSTQYDMHRELESDYRAGILSRQEYEEMEGPYLPGAKRVVAEDTAAPKSPEVHDEIEERVKELRQNRVRPEAKPGPASARVERPADRAANRGRGVQGKKALTCPKCGQAFREGDRFCTGCGARLKARGGRQ